jgi:hypothetical protein
LATTRSPLWLKRHQFESDLDEEMQLLAVCEVSSKVGEGGVMAKKAFKVVLKTENGQSEFTYAREHDPRSALGLALKRHTEPWIGKPKILPVYDANEIDSNPTPSLYSLSPLKT